MRQRIDPEIFSIWGKKRKKRGNRFNKEIREKEIKIAKEYFIFDYVKLISTF